MSITRRELDGGSGGREPSGGGVPGTRTATATGGLIPNDENGGLFGSTYVLFIPSQDVNSGLCYIGIYDTDNFNENLDGAYYKYREEDVAPDCTATVNRVILTYRDLGPAKITVTITGTNDNKEIVSKSVEVQIGNTIPTNALFTKRVDIQLTAIRPQLSWSRKLGDGPVCITAATLRGEVEDE